MREPNFSLGGLIMMLHKNVSMQFPVFILNFTGREKVLTSVLVSFAEDFMWSQQSSFEAEAKAS